MLAHIAVTRAPFIGSPLSHDQPVHLLFVPDDGSHTQMGKPDRVLIIEDDLLNASQMEVTLSEAGFDIIGVATTGEDALQIALTEVPDLAIVDIRLAGDRDGVDTALELFRTHGVRCIFATAHSDQEARHRAAAASPLGWLQKPYNMTALTSMVRAAVKAIRGGSSR